MYISARVYMSLSLRVFPCVYALCMHVCVCCICAAYACVSVCVRAYVHVINLCVVYACVYSAGAYVRPPVAMALSVCMHVCTVHVCLSVRR